MSLRDLLQRPIVRLTLHDDEFDPDSEPDGPTWQADLLEPSW